MKRVMINGRWPLNLPDHRAERESWPYWEATRLAAMHHFIQPGDVMYDVGAEAGDFAALFTTWGARVVLIEPNPKAWPTIFATFKMNDLRPEASAVVMLSDEHVGFAGGFAGGMHWNSFPDVARGPMVKAHGFYHIGEHNEGWITTLDLFNHELPAPDVVTMDVEGGEGHVLRGASRLLGQHKTAWFVSLHPQFMRDLYDEDVMDIHALMKGHGYHGRFLCEDHEFHFVWTHPDSGRMFPGVAEDYYIPGDRMML